MGLSESCIEQKVINKNIDISFLSTINININSKGARKAISTGMVQQARCIVGKICSTGIVYNVSSPSTACNKTLKDSLYTRLSHTHNVFSCLAASL